MTCPWKRFRDDLVKQLSEWQENGDRLIVCMDANEDIYNKNIGRTLTNADGLGMKEAIRDFTGKKLGATFFRGTKPIGGVWHTSDLVVTGACVMPAGYGVSDHRLFVINFLTSTLIGIAPPRVIRAQARQLKTNIPRAADRYVDKLEKEILQHNIIPHLGAAHESSSVKAIVKERVDKIDKETKHYMTNAGKKCRRIKSGRIPFSPDSAVWIRRC